MTRPILLILLLALTSCEKDKPASKEESHNESSESSQKQQEELAKFMADFNATMETKYGALKIVPEIKNTDAFKIEGTKIFNYNFHLTLHREDQLEPVKKELHRLMVVHQVETINFFIERKFKIPPSEQRTLQRTWRLNKDGTESKAFNMKSRKNREDVLDRLKRKPN